MPRATLKPYTIYEEIFGFAGTRRNAYVMFGVFSSLLLIKIVLGVNFSMYATGSPLLFRQDDPVYLDALQDRSEAARRVLERENRELARKQPPLA